MPTFTLNRTNEPPATLTGEIIGSVASSNATIRDRDTAPLQWFTLDLYRTQAGTIVAHAQYRAGSRLGRELPVDRVFTATSPEAMLDALNATKGHVFARGWPGAGEPDANRGKDYTSHHKSVMEHANEQWADVVGKARALLGFGAPAEEII